MEYKKLREGDFRLLRFLDESGLKICLETCIFQKAPPYVALSYRWEPTLRRERQSDDDLHCVELDSQMLEVSKNLHDVMRYLGPRVQRMGCALWIDAICINQADLDEKSRQIPMMKDIYLGSKCTYSWLGVPSNDEEIKSAVELMWAFDLWLEDGRKKDKKDTEIVANYVKSDQVGAPLDRTAPTWQAWQGIIEIFKQSYWQRVWIHQEATTPNEIHFFMGDHFFDGAMFSATCYFCIAFCRFSQQFNSLIRRTAFSALNINDARIKRQFDRDLGLLSSLIQMKHANCTDPRDRVFVATAYATDIGPDGYRVDYRRTLADVYADAARLVLSRSDRGGLDIFGQVVVPATDSVRPQLCTIYEPQLPSWVPDWRVRAVTQSLSNGRWARVGSHPLYHPCPGTEIHATFHGPELELRGHVREDLVPVHLTQIWDDEEGSIAIPRAWYNELTANGAEELDEPVRRSLVADKFCDETTVFEWERGAALDWSLLEHDLLSLSSSEVSRRRYMHMGLDDVAYLRRMARMSGGQIAILPAAARLGDQVAAFHGGNTLYLVRGVAGRQNAYNLIGECYVDGLMDGAFLEGAKASDKVARNIRLV